jgi:hypothetical protein
LFPRLVLVKFVPNRSIIAKQFEEDSTSALKLKKNAKTSATERASSGALSSKDKETPFKMGRWTKDEHFRFLAALKLFNKEWKRVQEHVGTRTST